MNTLHPPRKIVLIGAGIMSATLGILLQELMSNAEINICERLDQAGSESSDAWNNAGTGHSAFCELNYTPELKDGSVDISKALKIAQQFEISKQLWTYLKENHYLDSDKGFISDMDHFSLVWGADNVEFLKKRYETMVPYYLFEQMKYSEDRGTLLSWLPLMMKGRDHDYPIAATRMNLGTDVNFGEITRGMIRHLQKKNSVNVQFSTEVESIKRTNEGRWQIKYENRLTYEVSYDEADFIFIGAGGGTLKLLEMSHIPEADGYGGFPISGQGLRCNNPKVIEKHNAKVYGKAAKGSPPMSVPHLDTRIINNERCLLFGPYAEFSTKFLKNGSYLDLFLSVDSHNIWPMLRAGADNLDLTKYLITQVMQTKEDKFEYLQQYYPEAKIEDWELEIAGQRVQVIKKDKETGGKLQFGTEVVCSADGTLSALLGASPGASTSVSIMIEILERCFQEEMKSQDWIKKMTKMIPSYGQSLLENKPLLNLIRKRASEVLKID